MPRLNEVNAWENYERTGRSARTLTSRHGTNYNLVDTSVKINSSDHDHYHGRPKHGRSSSEHGPAGSFVRSRSSRRAMISQQKHDQQHSLLLVEEGKAETGGTRGAMTAATTTKVWSGFFSSDDLQSLQTSSNNKYSLLLDRETTSVVETGVAKVIPKSTETQQQKKQAHPVEVEEQQAPPHKATYSFPIDNISQLREIFGIYFEGTYNDGNATTDFLATGRNYSKRRVKRMFCNNCFFISTVMMNVHHVLKSINGTMPWSQIAIESFFGRGQEEDTTYLDRYRWEGDDDGGDDESSFLLRMCRRCSIAPLLLFVDYCLRGIAQVYFQNNPMSGFFILIGLWIQSPRVTVHGLLALMSGTLLAIVLGFDFGLIASGLFGYNSLLVGLALATFHHKQDEYTVATMIASMIFGAFSSIVFIAFSKVLVPYKSPPFTLPFNIATITFLLATADMQRIAYHPVRNPSIPDYFNDHDDHNTNEVYTMSVTDFFLGIIRGIGQVYLADNWISGVLILIGITICSRISALAAIYGSILGSCVTFAVSGLATTTIYQGLYGFNASLTVTSILMFYTPNWGSVALGTMAGIMTVFCQQAFTTLLLPWGLPFMTLPFCFVSLSFIILQGTTTLVFAIPLVNLSTPEDHVHKTTVLRNGFNLFLAAIRPNGKESFSFSKTMTKHLEQLSWIIHSAAPTKTHTTTTTYKNNNHGTYYNAIQSRIQQNSTKKQQNSFAMETAFTLFPLIDTDETGRIHLDQFCSALSSVGLTATEGIQFASLIFHLMDFHKLQTMGLFEFALFCELSATLRAIRNKVVKFIDFIDIDGNQLITFDEIDAALEYLGQSGLSEEDRNKITRVLNIHHKDDNDKYDDNNDEGIDSIQLVNYITVTTVKVMVEAYHRNNLNMSKHNTAIAATFLASPVIHNHTNDKNENCDPTMSIRHNTDDNDNDENSN